MNRLFSIPKSEGKRLRLDFSGFDFLSTFEINELFFHILTNHEFTDFEVVGATPPVDYLERINFFYELERIAGIKRRSPSPYTGRQSRLHELKTFRFKPEFEGNAHKIHEMFLNIGLSTETASLLVTSLLEVADNAFGHNLGQWPFKTGPLVVGLIQEYPHERKLSLSLLDFGVGFRNTLLGNYQALKNEQEAIQLAIQPNTTGRASNKGGNGLYYLQKNIFNGFSGTLTIRSVNTQMKIIGQGKAVLLESTLPFSFGANVGFDIKY